MFVRLLRHSRQILPEAVGSVAEIVRFHLNQASEKSLPQLTLLYNRALSLLSAPTSLEPFRFSQLLKRVQFDVLRAMDESDPAIPINQEGYRAIARTQLAQKKMPNEQEWARLKAKSWPPFKQERTGVDVEKGVELGISGAAKALQYMQETGYPAASWDQRAKIYAGWDIDGSPTIQTRKMMPKMPSAPPQEPVNERTKQAQLHRVQLDIWAARIEATRTLEEAWASFLAYEDTSLPADQEVYLAMYKKIHYDEKRRQAESHEQDETSIALEMDEVLPGDGKEVFASSESPQERIYVRAPPPSLHTFFDHLMAKGFELNRDCQISLIMYAPSLEAGIKAIVESRNAHVSCFMLRSAQDVEIARNGRHRLVLSAIVGLLCRFRYMKRLPYLNQAFLQQLSLPPALFGSRLNFDHPMHHVDRLMRLTNSTHRPTWNIILSLFASNQHFVRQLDGTALDSIRRVVTRMKALGLDLDAYGLQSICRALEHLAADPAASSPTRNAACSQYLRRLFVELFGGTHADEPLIQPFDTLDSDMQQVPLPRLLATPRPALLHPYARALGALEDYEGLLSLAQWMVQYKPELLDAVGDSASRDRLMRRTLVAVRFYLEGSAEAPREVVELARGWLEKLEEWGGWQESEDVEVYARVGAGRAQRKKQ
ncbi:hypothetical protein W97_08184 [Coniosporium apollinis CBS 100218]|uniref:Uncharacterized protein n=1 Tax=Coniosporium apollinis (strain CBS 100218) TaxID=1168221 RepID=R7Z4Q7_CONA1|nr:uncharacterized protein W97_08184 [Coniosporium apollinis CBS 100218]EON68926.1 hypothetical protein W97_08184 [Coniosporium apollinis CBS 100218]